MNFVLLKVGAHIDDEPEPEYNEDARRKLAATGLESDEEEAGAGEASGYDTDDNQADAPADSRQPHGEDAELAAAGAVKGGKKKQKQSRPRSKSRDRDTKGTPRLKKRQREPGQSAQCGSCQDKPVLDSVPIFIFAVSCVISGVITNQPSDREMCWTLMGKLCMQCDLCVVLLDGACVLSSSCVMATLLLCCS